MTGTFHRMILLAPLAALLLAAAPVEAPPFAQRLAAAGTLVDQGRLPEAIAALDALLAEADLPVDKGQVQAIRSFALARLGRFPESRAAIEQAYAAAPDPTPLLLRQLFVMRALTGDADAAAQTLQLIAATNAQWLNDVPSDLVNDVLRAIRKDETRSFDVTWSLVGAGWSPPDATLSDADWPRLTVIAGLAQRGRLDEAGPIVDKLVNSVSLVRLAIDRRYQSLWPALEKRLGRGADTADAAFVAAAKARFDAAPASNIARLGYAEALNIASREPEALTIADVATTPEAMAPLRDRELWLVNLAAVLMADAGQNDLALKRLDDVVSLPPAGRPSLLAMLINRALLAEAVDRPDAALAAATVAETQAGDMTQFGRLFLAQVRACAATQQGRRADALAAAAPLIASPEANDDAYLTAMICLGRMDDAARAVIRRLDAPDTRTEMLFDLQPFLIANHPKVREARLRAGLRALKARADVKAAFGKWGRDLPAAVAPPR